MLVVRDLSKRYADRVALAGVSFEVHPGEIVGLLGANGAGKSTLLRTAAGLQPPDEGTITIAGHEVWDAPLAARAEAGYAAEEPSFYDELSGSEHLAFVAGVRAIDPATARERAHALGGALGLETRLDDPVRSYSHGMRKKLSFLAAAAHRPRVLLCDEALEGFDAPAALAAKRELRALAAVGTAVLFSSHVTETVERLCDRILVLHDARLVRTLERREWASGSEAGPSRLETIFLAMLGPPVTEARP